VLLAAHGAGAAAAERRAIMSPGVGVAAAAAAAAAAGEGLLFVADALAPAAPEVSGPGPGIDATEPLRARTVPDQGASSSPGTVRRLHRGCRLTARPALHTHPHKPQSQVPADLADLARAGGVCAFAAAAVGARGGPPTGAIVVGRREAGGFSRDAAG
jgi:hypothetical protein